MIQLDLGAVPQVVSTYLEGSMIVRSAEGSGREVCRKIEKVTCKRRGKIIKLGFSQGIFHSFGSSGTRGNLNCSPNRSLLYTRSLRFFSLTFFYKNFRDLS